MKFKLNRIIAIIVILTILLAIFNLYYLDKKIKENGGIKNCIIKIGREIKNIIHEIDADTSTEKLER